MKLFPAIDIMNNRAVRLLYGKKDAVTDYGNPLDRAKMWQDMGAKYLHIVDLDGAFEGNAQIDDTINKIALMGIKVQSGGGLRTMQAIQRRLEAGAQRVILGTICHTNPELFEEALKRYGDRIVAGIDCKDGYLSLKGWTENSTQTGIEFGKRAKFLGVKCCVFTDVSRDGALSGVALKETVKLGKETGLDVIASGGIANMSDLENLEKNNVYGAILGRSIYEKSIDLKEAVDRFENRKEV